MNITCKYDIGTKTNGTAHLCVVVDSDGYCKIEVNAAGATTREQMDLTFTLGQLKRLSQALRGAEVVASASPGNEDLFA